MQLYTCVWRIRRLPDVRSRTVRLGVPELLWPLVPPLPLGMVELGVAHVMTAVVMIQAAGESLILQLPPVGAPVGAPSGWDGRGLLKCDAHIGGGGRNREHERSLTGQNGPCQRSYNLLTRDSGMS